MSLLSRVSRVFPSTFFIVALSLIPSSFISTASGDPVPWKKSVTFTSDESEILNPDRGIYRFRPLAGLTDFQSVRDSGATLIYAELDLSSFRESALSDDKLADIQDAFTAIEQAGIKAIVRIVYSHAIGEEDAPIERIRGHLAQLKPVFERNAHLVYAFQAGCMGPWGEWHSSKHHADTVSARRALIGLLLEELPRSVQVHLRRPSFKKEFIESDPSSAGRLGHHNDCILSNETDSGTYPLDQVDQLREFIAADSWQVGVGGETCQVNASLTQCKTALVLFARVGMSYLNADYHPEVIEGFKAQGCWKTIANLLGYRLQPVRLDVEVDGEQKNLKGSLSLENRGWAPLYQRRAVVIRLRQGERLLSEQSLDSLDVREIGAGARKSASFTLPFLPSDQTPVQLSIALPDIHPSLAENPNYSVRLASKEAKWNSKNGENILLTITLPLK